jgi:hypothetical protein
LGGSEQKLLAINPDGTIKWDLIFRQVGFGWYTVGATPAIGKDGALALMGQFFEPVKQRDGTIR